MTAPGATYYAFARWMDDHDRGPGARIEDVRQASFPFISYLTIGQWIARYRREMS